MRLTSNVIIDAEPPSVRRSRTQQYFPSEGNRTTFHHYVPTNGGKVKSTQSVLPAGVDLSNILSVRVTIPVPVHAGMRTREHWLEHRDNYTLLHRADLLWYNLIAH